MTLEEIKNLALQIYENSLTSVEREEFEYPKCVLSDGPINSKIMILARDLGEEEIKLELPLIGKAGQLLREVECKLVEKGIQETETYKTNIVPFKPRNNKAFSKSIRTKFRPVLLQQISLVNPKIILAVGNEALEELTGGLFGIMNKIYNNEIYKTLDDIQPKCIVVPCIHPSFVIRQNRDRNIMKDLLVIPMIRVNQLLKGENFNEKN